MSRSIMCLLAPLLLVCSPLAAQPSARSSAQATSAEAIKTLPGFKVERLYSVLARSEGSWVSMTVDPRGRLIVCDQYGGLFRVTPPPLGQAGEAAVEPLKVEIGGAHGLLWAFDSLYVTCNEGRAGKQAGLYRVRDTNGDDQLDEVTLLRRIEGGGEHGPHAVVLAPDGKSLYLVAGNFTKTPNPERSAVAKVWGEDQLLPRMPDAGGHDPHILAPAGWICRTDPDGKAWELVASGFRNAYDVALNRDGELFAYDSDMEWDIGAPWYRPTRVCHAVDGAEFGFRNGSGKWPPYYADSLPAVVDIGPGSPTGMVFGYGAKFPAKYQEALYLLDWSYGIIFAAHLTPAGASYTATFEQFVSGVPLPVTDAAIGPDGAMYFTIGGRRTQSGLYRVSYVGNEPTSPAKIPADPASTKARALRHELESLYFQADSAAAIDKAWPYLGHADRFIRYAARTAIEHQPVAAWQARALADAEPQALLTALLAVVRCGDRSLQPQVLAALAKLDWNKLSQSQKLELLRVYALSFIRQGKPDGPAAEAIADLFDACFPADTYPLNHELAALLVYLDAPGAVAKCMDLLAKAPTQQEQIHYALVLRTARAGWTPQRREAYFRWFARAAEFRGGHSFAGFLRNMKTDALGTLTPGERVALGSLLDDPRPAKGPPQPPRKFVKEYKLDELLPLVESGLKKRSFDNGRAIYSAAQCANCHRFADEGSIGGPDLTALAGRFNARDLLESIVDPDKVISDQYQATTFVLDDGRQITGRIVNQNGDGIHVLPNMLAPDEVVTIRHRSIEETAPSRVSPMPAGLLNTLTRDEILDMAAYLLSRGDRQSEMFR